MLRCKGIPSQLLLWLILRYSSTTLGRAVFNVDVDVAIAAVVDAVVDVSVGVETITLSAIFGNISKRKNSENNS